MSDSTISTALQRVAKTFTLKPGLALQPDTSAHASLQGGLAIEVRHPDGHVVRTDMPAAMGGGGAEVSPGWLMRAGLAACTATVIAMQAQRLGINLTRLDVSAHSRSDARGMLGLDESVPAGPLEMELRIDLASDNADDQALAELAAWGDRHSPIGNAVRRPIALQVIVNGKPGAVH